ncbi:MAG: uroporphyrinogen-III synthase [Oscillospiraceae bacterium]|nr:uroporphyrinogen-III synthase [Oscillospiraceae bacterium]
MAEYSIRADLCPAEFTSEALALALAEGSGEGEPVWLFDSAQGSGVIPERLGSRCRRISLYETVYETIPGVPAPDFLLLGSAGAVNALADSGFIPAERTTPICIGPVCADAFERRFGRVPLRPAQITTRSMVERVLEEITRSESRR